MNYVLKFVEIALYIRIVSSLSELEKNSRGIYRSIAGKKYLFLFFTTLRTLKHIINKNNFTVSN